MDLYRRYMLAVTGVFLVVAGFISWQVHERISRNIEEAKRQRVELLTEIVANGLKAIMLEGKPKEEFQRFLDTIAAEDIHAVRIFSDNGIILSSTVPGEAGGMVDELHVLAFKSHKDTGLFSHQQQGRMVYSSIIVMSNDWPCQRCHGSDDKIRAIVDLDVTQEKMDNTEKQAVGWSVFAYLSAVAVLCLAVSLLFRMLVIRHVMNIGSKTRAIAEGDVSVRISSGGADELNSIASDVNRIAEKLERAQEEVRSYASRETGHMEKMASIGELAATVAHEIKNPLAGISGALQVMAEDIPEESPRKEICNDILAEIERLDIAVKELIVFARPQEINPVIADVNEITEKALGSVSDSAAAMGVRLQIVCGALPDTMVDPDQFEKVLRNVMLYQMQLMPDGGTITVSTEYDRATDEIDVISADTASAMSNDRIRNIFRPSFSTKHTGTGLGLAVSRNIIESHNGRIKVESEPGAGNFFHIIIPGRVNNGKS